MIESGSTIIYRRGRRPEDQKYPGHGYRMLRENGIIIERDVAVELRDGVRIFVDVYRPEGTDRVPPLIVWSPYGKHSPRMYDRYPNLGGVKKEWFSDFAIWEGPDPVYWVPRGYAIVVPDARGSWYSEGKATFWSKDEAKDYHDVIEWAATCPWSNGKVGTSGVSYLAISQWQVAATQPPHLAAINPWEGLSDMYREFSFHGGMPDDNFVHNWAEAAISFSINEVEDVVEMQKRHPFFDDYWAARAADLSKIEVPAYVVASWSDQGLHTRGTLEGFKRISSKQKWLEVHGQKKWEYFLRPDNVEKQRKFFDHFLKGTDDEVLNWPKVRIEIRERYGVGRFREEREWPLARTVYAQLFLDATDSRLKKDLPAVEAKQSYESRAEQGTSFDFEFSKETELTGHMKLKLWIEIEQGEDADLFVAIQKLDDKGDLVPFAFYSAFEHGPVAQGWLRASHRELDPTRSKPEQPWLLHQREQKLKPREPVPVEIEIWPSSTLFRPGERLRVHIQGTDIPKFPAGLRMIGHIATRNVGQHTIRTGGKHDSHLLIPVISS
jgi:uncharacterized protein